MTNSIAYQSFKKNPSTPYGFYNNYDKYDKICYSGMEKHFYGRETIGPGGYLSNDTVQHSLLKTSQRFSMTKKDRGLLTSKPSKTPGPLDYKHPEVNKVKKKEGEYRMPTATRDIHFSKYSSVHNELVTKGIV